MPLMSGEILLVGSIPLESADEVFRHSAKYLGPYLSAIPDGEFGPRMSWIGYLIDHVYRGHPDIIVSEDATKRLIFRLKTPGKAPHITTGYGNFALQSYETFSKLKLAGDIPSEMRFQVCFPSTSSAFSSSFRHSDDWSSMVQAYENAFARDVQEILTRISPDELAIQIDVCMELRDLVGGRPGLPVRPNVMHETIASVARLSTFVPPDALLGLHWCYGTWGGWPMVQIDTLELCTKLTNEAIERVSRRLDYVHMPVPADAGDKYFAPLRDLSKSDTRTYLGLIHHTDGIDGFRGRLKTARRHFTTDFGVASVCGYGRLSQDDTRLAFEVHKEAGAFMRAEHAA